MSETDKFGVAYAQLSHLRPGSRIRTDGGMLCETADGNRYTKAVCRTVQVSAGALWFKCPHGKHLLDGQLMDDGDSLLGVYNV